MGLDFSFPWALLLLPLGILAVWLIDRRYRTRVRSLKRRAALWMRLCLVCVVVLAAASPSVLLSSGKTIRWILMDVSDSTASVQPEMREALQTALHELPSGEEAGVIVFGDGASVETPLSEEPVFTGVQSSVAGGESDLDSALTLAGALMPSDGAGGVTLISDGNATLSQSTAAMLAARGIPVDTLTITPQSASDAQISELNAPSLVYEGQRVSVQVVIDATTAMEGTLALLQNGEPTATRDVSLAAGENRFAFTDTALHSGVAIYEARLLCPADSQSRNNSASTYVRVSGAPSVLLVSQTKGVNSLFDAAGMRVTAILAQELPDNADGYLPYDAIVLNNIDYDAASEAQWEALNGAVRTLGRGLCVLGGDSSYALGSYRGTVLEELLPVSIDVRNKLQMPALSLVIAIDKSGSMTDGQYGISRIEVAKEAAMRAVEVLNERDNIGVIGFDSEAKWVVPFQRVSDASAIQSMIGTMRADGGTAFFSPLSIGYEALAATDTPQRHMIFLSDGQPADTGFQDIALAMSKSGITLTTVAVGSGADTSLMSLLSALGGGRSYTAGEFDNIPKIFTKETMLAGGSYVQNRVFTPIITETSALTAFDGFPALSGYMTAVEKPTATVSLQSDTEDPLLSWWYAGVGKVIAWMSDAEGAWTESFLQWEDAPAFFGGLVANSLSGSNREGTLLATADGEELQISYTVNAADEEALQTEVSIAAPDGTVTTVPLLEASPGVYEGVAPAPVQGAYALSVTQTRDGEQVRTQEGGAVRSYAPEYDIRQVAGVSPAELSSQTGGYVLADGERFFSSEVTGTKARRSLTTPLLILSLLLLLMDIALRKLPWEDAFAKLLAHITGNRKTAEAKDDQPQEKPAPVKPRREGRAAKEQARAQAAQQTTNALLDAKRARNRQ